MNIVIISAFRNASSHITRWYNQCVDLGIHARKSGDHKIRAIAVEGDSTDDTLKKLTDLGWYTKNSPLPGFEIDLIKHNHGQRVFSSTEDSDRLSALTGVMLAGMFQVRRSDDVVLYVESDLIWTPHNVGSLIDLAYRREGGFDIIAPLVFAGENFYDTWAFRKNGVRFSPFTPYHKSLAYSEDLKCLVDLNSSVLSSITQVDSIGSCFACRGEVIRRTIKHLKGEEGLVSFCNSAREIGYKVGVDTRFRVEHP